MISNSGWKGYDKYVLDHFTEKIGCRPLYWDVNKSMPPCSNIVQMKNAHEPFKYYTFTQFLSEIQEPCQNIETLGVTYTEDYYQNEYPNGTSKEKVFDIILRFRDLHRFKEVKQVKSYDAQSLIGNTGGYIGLCLGWSIFQIPEVVISFLRCIKRE